MKDAILTSKRLRCVSVAARNRDLAMLRCTEASAHQRQHAQVICDSSCQLHSSDVAHHSKYPQVKEATKKYFFRACLSQY